MNSISLQIKKKRFEPVHRVQSPAVRRILHRIIQFHLPVPVRPMSFLRRFPGRGVPLRQLPLLPYGLRSRPADLVAGQLGRQHHNLPAAGPADSNLPSHPGRPALLPYYIIRFNIIAIKKKHLLSSTAVFHYRVTIVISDTLESVQHGGDRGWLSIQLHGESRSSHPVRLTPE